MAGRRTGTLERCPRCGSDDVDFTDRKSELSGAAGVIVIGLILAFLFPPVLIIVVPAGAYLVFKALRAQPEFTCLSCRHRWTARDSAAASDGGEAGGGEADGDEAGPDERGSG